MMNMTNVLHIEDPDWGNYMQYDIGAAAGIEISTVNQGAGKLNLLIGVPEERYEDAIRAIYRTMQEG